jgi:pimeloyl-ACP methyl ester carboxylesterase
VESSIYLNSREAESNIYPEVAQIQVPVVVVRAGRERKHGVFDLAASPTAPDLASKFPRGREVLLADATHFIPMEQPERVAEEIRELVAATSVRTTPRGESARL